MRREDYTVGWISALPREQLVAVLDEVHDKLPARARDTTYILGRIDCHNVVMVCLPSTGTTSTARCVARLEESFQNLRFILLVGVGGGVPTRRDIRLGDVVVSMPTKFHSGIVQYDFGTKFQDENLEILPHALGRPQDMLVTAVSALSTRYAQNATGKSLGQVLHSYTVDLAERSPEMKTLSRPKDDQLFVASYRHLDDTASCAECHCDTAKLVQRPIREQHHLSRIHQGLIASGNKVMRDALERDRLSMEMDVLCFEMEAAGLKTDLGWLVIRGICDYCDSHKNKDWQDYAAAVAAGYARELLYTVPGLEKDMRRSEYEFGLNLADAPQIDEEAFIGREPELMRLQKLLVSSSDSQRIVVISGIGGVGKTQLSICFAKRFRTDFSSIFWINAKSEAVLKEGFVRLANRVLGDGATSTIESENDTNRCVQRVLNWLSLIENSRWLVIFDNYDDPDLPGMKSPTGYDIRNYFPITSQGAILITSRSTRLDFAKQSVLRPLEDINQCLAVLAQRSGRDVDDVDAQKLVERLSGLPLALATAGMYLKQSTNTFAEYLSDYESHWEDLQQYSPTLLEYEDRTLYTTWNLSLARLKTQDERAVKLLGLIACLDNQDIWYELFQGTATGRLAEAVPKWFSDICETKFRFTSIMLKLQSFSLVEIQDRSYRMHTCVHDWALQILSPEKLDIYCRLAVECISENYTIDTQPNYWVSNLRLLPHAVRLVQGRLKRFTRKCDLQLGNLAITLEEGDHLAEAEEILEHAITNSERVYGSEDTSLLPLIGRLGNTYYKRLKLEQAERMYKRYLEIDQKQTQPDDELTLAALNNMGSVYATLGKTEKAEQLFNRVISHWAEIDNPENPRNTSNLWAMSNLAHLYAHRRPEQAESLYERTIAECEKVLGINHLLTLSTLMNFGTLCRLKAKLDRAEQLQKRALLGYETALGNHHSSTLVAAHQLCKTYMGQGRRVEAEEMLQRARRGFQIMQVQNVDDLLQEINEDISRLSLMH